MTLGCVFSLPVHSVFESQTIWRYTNYFAYLVLTVDSALQNRPMTNNNKQYTTTQTTSHAQSACTVYTQNSMFPYRFAWCQPPFQLMATSAWLDMIQSAAARLPPAIQHMRLYRSSTKGQSYSEWKKKRLWWFCWKFKNSLNNNKDILTST